MEEKAQILIYDDLVVIDETETYFKDKEQLTGIAASCLHSTPNAEMVEVYIGGKLKMKYKITNRGKVKKESLHPGWGGYRVGAGAKKKGTRCLDRVLHFKVDEVMYDYVNKMDSRSKAKWLREAVQEKIDKETEKG